MKKLYSLLLLVTVISPHLHGGMNRAQITNYKNKFSNAVSQNNMQQACAAYTALTNAGYAPNTDDLTQFESAFGDTAANLCSGNQMMMQSPARLKSAFSTAVQSAATMTNLKTACKNYTALVNNGYSPDQDDLNTFAATFGGPVSALCDPQTLRTLQEVPATTLSTLQEDAKDDGTDPSSIAQTLQNVAGYIEVIGAPADVVATLQKAATNLGSSATTTRTNAGQCTTFVSRTYKNIFPLIDPSFTYNDNMVTALVDTNQKGKITTALNTFIGDLNTTLDAIIANSNNKLLAPATSLAGFSAKMKLAQTSAVKQQTQASQLQSLNGAIDSIRTTLSLPVIAPQATDFDDALTNLTTTAKEAKTNSQAGIVNTLNAMIENHNQQIAHLFDADGRWDEGNVVDASGNIIGPKLLEPANFNTVLTMNEDAQFLAAACQEAITNGANGNDFETLLVVSQKGANAGKILSVSAMKTVITSYSDFITTKKPTTKFQIYAVKVAVKNA